MARHMVCLTFDFDGMSGWIARGLTGAVPISRGEFGIVGCERILALLNKYNIITTWFIPGITIGTYPEMSQRIADAGHEIGYHGWTHVPPANMSKEKEEEGIVRGNEAIQKLAGRKAVGYRCPSWDITSYTIDFLVKHDFLYDTSLMADDYIPYRARSGDQVFDEEPMIFGKKTPLIEMPISWTLDDYPHFEFVRTQSYVLQGLMNANSVFENWFGDFLYMKENLDWGVLTYTCHPYVSGRGHRMLALEGLIKKLVEHGAVFTTMEEAAREFNERSPM